MKINKVLVLLSFVLVSKIYSQTNINNYKYVIVPKKFGFLKEENKYRLNELTQFLFNKHGFIALLEGESYPEDLLFNNCLALRSNVVKDAAVFSTKLKIELKNCNDKLIYTSRIGQSREKEYKKAYTLAVRDAFESFKALNYKYVPVKQSKTVKSSDTTQEIKKLKEELNALKKEKQNVVVTTKKADDVIKKEVVTSIQTTAANTLYAQKIDNGFQLVDSTPKVVYKLLNSGLKNVFLVEAKSAIVYKKENIWVIEYYKNNNLNQEKLNIKF